MSDQGRHRRMEQKNAFSSEENRLLIADLLLALDQRQKENGPQNGPQAGNPEQQTMTIDLAELFFFILSKLHYIILGTILGGLLMGVFAVNRVVPIYTATSKLYIVGQTGSSILSDLQIGMALTMDYQEIFKTWEVHQMVNESLGTDYPYSELQKKLSVQNPKDTRVLYISVQDTEPKMASDIANAYAEAAKKFIISSMDSDAPRTFSLALVPSEASNMNVAGYVIRGCLLGTVAVGGLLVLLFLLDNRPHSPEELQRLTGLPTLAVIPANPHLSGDKEHKKKDKQRNRKRAREARKS